MANTLFILESLLGIKSRTYNSYAFDCILKNFNAPYARTGLQRDSIAAECKIVSNCLGIILAPNNNLDVKNRVRLAAFQLVLRFPEASPDVTILVRVRIIPPLIDPQLFSYD